ncbi:N-acetyltransferase [Pseudonocardiaceae bacterium YIM PH 21723]|nr:N-acetyltransferase [Pseudonocardiaceae bacterium YIM PH 21723]
MGKNLRLEPVTEDNFEQAIEIKVAPDQEDFVATVEYSLAEAYVNRNKAWPRVIMDDDTMVGFVMAFYDDEFEGRLISGLWRLNIDAAHQGKGYGRFAVRAVGEEILRRGTSTVITTSWGEGEHGPEKFYRRLGFVPTGETVADGEIVAELALFSS